MLYSCCACREDGEGAYACCAGCCCIGACGAPCCGGGGEGTVAGATALLPPALPSLPQPVLTLLLLLPPLSCCGTEACACSCCSAILR